MQQRLELVNKSININRQMLTMVGALVFLWLLFGFLTSFAFFSPRNISNIFRQSTVISFMAAGMVLVIVTGNIDLSVGKVAGFVSVVAAALQAWILPPVLAAIMPGADPFAVNFVSAIITVLLGVGVGALIGLAQGVLIARFGVPSFIVTLGGLFIFRGAILAVTEGKTIPANQPVFDQIGGGYLPAAAGWVLAILATAAAVLVIWRSRLKKIEHKVPVISLELEIAKTAAIVVAIWVFIVIVNQFNGLPVPVLLLGMIAVLLHYVANNTRFGRYAYAIGGNREAARLSGINVPKNILKIFVLMGTLCGVAGVTLASYVGFGTISAGEAYELDVIAACILGGTSTLGGEGTVIGALLGALIMTTLSAGLTMMNVQPSFVYMIKGLVFISAALVDVLVRRQRTTVKAAA